MSFKLLQFSPLESTRAIRMKDVLERWTEGFEFRVESDSFPPRLLRMIPILPKARGGTLSGPQFWDWRSQLRLAEVSGLDLDC